VIRSAVLWAFSGLVLPVGLVAGASSTGAISVLETLHRTIMLRPSPDGTVQGADETDPLVWGGTQYFLAGESLARLIAGADAVANLPAQEVSRCPPAQRALVQNRLWALFDFLDAHLGKNREDEPYLRGLAKAMAKLALTDQELASIPDPLGEAARSGQWPLRPSPESGADIFLPEDLARGSGPWVALGRADGNPVAPLHLRFFGARSAFEIRARFPDGGPSVPAYFKIVSEEPTPWISTSKRDAFGHPLFRLNPSMPELPRGAQFVLVRTLLVVDRDARVRTTPLVLTAQFRMYWANEPAHGATNVGGRMIPSPIQPQSLSEFTLATDAVAAGEPPRLRAIAPDEGRFTFFFDMGIDQVKSVPQKNRNAPLRACLQCHGGPGLLSINSTLGTEGSAFSPGKAVPFAHLVAEPAGTEGRRAAAGKLTQPDWKALLSFWPHP